MASLPQVEGVQGDPLHGVISAGGLGATCATDRAWQDLMRECRGDSLATIGRVHASGWQRGPSWSRWRNPAPFPGHVCVFSQRDGASATVKENMTVQSEDMRGEACLNKTERRGRDCVNKQGSCPESVLRGHRWDLSTTQPATGAHVGMAGGLGRPCTYDPPSVSPSATEEREGSRRKWANGCWRESRRGKKRIRLCHLRRRRRASNGKGGWVPGWAEERVILHRRRSPL